MKALLTILFALSTLMSVAQKSDGAIIEQTEVVLPAYETVQGIDRYYPKSIYDETISDLGWTIKKLWYYSDGLKVAAFVATPSVVKGKYPVIIFNRGSSVRNDIAFVHAPLFRKFVQNGFVVIAPVLRQSEGSEGKDEIGGADIHDILNIAKVYPQLSFVDSKNVFMLGESRGGIMTFLAMKNGMNINAGATVGAITDLEAYLNDNSWMNPQEVWPNYTTNQDIRES